MYFFYKMKIIYLCVCMYMNLSINMRNYVCINLKFWKKALTLQSFHYRYKWALEWLFLIKPYKSALFDGRSIKQNSFLGVRKFDLKFIFTIKVYAIFVHKCHITHLWCIKNQNWKFYGFCIITGHILYFKDNFKKYCLRIVGF